MYNKVTFQLIIKIMYFNLMNKEENDYSVNDISELLLLKLPGYLIKYLVLNILSN